MGGRFYNIPHRKTQRLKKMSQATTFHTSERKANPPARKLCRGALDNSCTWGATCRDAHPIRIDFAREEVSRKKDVLTVCSNFLNGNCRSGAGCKFLHIGILPQEALPNKAPAESPQRGDDVEAPKYRARPRRDEPETTKPQGQKPRRPLPKQEPRRVPLQEFEELHQVTSAAKKLLNQRESRGNILKLFPKLEEAKADIQEINVLLSEGLAFLKKMQALQQKLAAGHPDDAEEPEADDSEESQEATIVADA